MVVTDLSMLMSMSDPRPGRVGFVVDELVKEQVLHRVLSAVSCQYHAPHRPMFNNSPTGYNLSK